MNLNRLFFALSSSSITQQDKITNIEVVRCLAAIGIVWFHDQSASWRTIGYAGLPIFVILFISLPMGQFSCDSFNIYIRKRFSRLILPWIFWSIVYALTKIAYALWMHKEIDFLFKPQICLIGTNIHLWFLPFAFLSSVILYFFFNFILKVNKRWMVACAFLLGLTALVISSFILMISILPSPFEQWLFAVPALFFGLAIGLSSKIKNIKNRAASLSLIGLLTIGLCILLCFFKMSNLAVPYAIGVFLVTAAYLIKSPFKTFWITLGSLTYGIYLIHPLIASILHQLFPSRYSWIVIISTYCISMILIWLTKKTSMRIFI